MPSTRAAVHAARHRMSLFTSVSIDPLTVARTMRIAVTAPRMPRSDLRLAWAADRVCGDYPVGLAFAPFLGSPLAHATIAATRP